MPVSVYMGVPQTDREDRDRPSRARESGGQFATIDSSSYAGFGIRGRVFCLRTASGTHQSGDQQYRRQSRLSQCCSKQ
jgi:hypothetical protein